MLRIERIQGKSIKEWAAADLPHGAFAEMARGVDPFWGIFAEAGAVKKRYRVSGPYSAHQAGCPEIIVEAFSKHHARAIAFDEKGWKPEKIQVASIHE